jgi:tRNA(fMet)-specific endonuclease VapC
MTYLLDTNVCIQLLNNKNACIIANLSKHHPSEIAVCSIVKAELLYGARRSQRIEANLALLNAFFAPLISFSFDDMCAEHYGQIHTELLTKGTPIGLNDTLIAAIARANNLTLVTHNTREFGRVPDLKLVDWEKNI